LSVLSLSLSLSLSLFCPFSSSCSSSIPQLYLHFLASVEGNPQRSSREVPLHSRWPRGLVRVQPQARFVPGINEYRSRKKAKETFVLLQQFHFLYSCQGRISSGTTQPDVVTIRELQRLW
jgi:hypothetical protein